ncbi:MAG: HEPN family nuclease [Candidatus Thioglobus sp.]|uniref:HEPN family nuclease n=1 Tax=Candidatus Thioglobus sp. TaxID=2026721 RepID=UPI0026097CEA|nr:HEPN family nuclease [Candidatus Thioglobus sp.]MDC9726606.1 HEPN family nuclease [Candidatus Thioglobus sp.]
MNKNAFLDAKNSLLMVRILARLDIERPGNEWLDKVISEVENANGYQKKVPLVNQTVFLSMAYSTLVWLRESYFKNKKAKKALSNRVMPLFSNHKIKIDKGEKAKEIGEKAPIEFIRRIRNSLGHANVSIEDNYFIFYDVNPKEKTDSVKIKMSWHALGELTEMVIAAGNDVLFE